MLALGIVEDVSFQELIQSCTSEAKPMSRRTLTRRIGESQSNKIVYNGFVIFHCNCNIKFHALSYYDYMLDHIMLLQLISFAQLSVVKLQQNYIQIAIL